MTSCFIESFLLTSYALAMLVLRPGPRRQYQTIDYEKNYSLLSDEDLWSLFAKNLVFSPNRPIKLFVVRNPFVTVQLVILGDMERHLFVWEGISKFEEQKMLLLQLGHYRYISRHTFCSRKKKPTRNNKRESHVYFLILFIVIVFWREHNGWGTEKETYLNPKIIN